ncbi:hypothetical protein BCR44DRAFT_1427780 [Catenaria anguillulae PL171]|uniref:Putative lipoate-protein ligase A n=1 Tax=Catenaria anguillulae PL171 TaxID=765915 RepID=A0A1Y2HW10_9FUNG|nr:hypothetical protein BCR44DRAFT_1427780 [Catenaria anguillulae PL171]
MTRPEVRAYRSLSTNPYLNLAIEEWLFRTTPPSSHILLLWRNSPCVCNVHHLAADSIPWLRRKSGGGTVFHDLGNSIYSIIEPRETFTRRKNAELVARVNERHDLVVDGKKVSGSAFKLTNTPVAQVLEGGSPKVGHKGRSKCSFASHQSARVLVTVDHGSFCEAVVDQFRKQHDLGYLKVETVDEQVVEREVKVREAYEELMSDDWKLGQTPEFVNEIDLVDAGLICNVSSRQGRITAIDFVPNPTLLSAKAEYLQDELFVAGMEDLKLCLQGKWYHPTAVHQAWCDLVQMQHGAISESHTAMVKIKRVADQLATLL